MTKKMPEESKTNNSPNCIAQNVSYQKMLFCLLVFLAALWLGSINGEAFSTLPFIIAISFSSVLLNVPGQVLGVNIEVAADEYSNLNDTYTPNI